MRQPNASHFRLVLVLLRFVLIKEFFQVVLCDLGDDAFIHSLLTSTTATIQTQNIACNRM